MPERPDSRDKGSVPPEETPPKNKPKRSRKRKTELPPALLWSRSIGLFSSLAGGGLGIIQPQFFWLSAILVCGGLLLLGVDLYFEPGLSRKFKGAGEIGLMLMLSWFCVRVVFVNAPFNFMSMASNIDYPTGTAPGGIAWRSVFTELDLIVTNPTDGNYDNIDILVRPDYPIAAIAQMSNLSDVSFEDNLGVTNRATIEDLESQVGAPLVFLATDAGYKVHCGRIPPNNSLRIVMAVVDVKKSQPRDPNRPIIVPGDVSLDDFFLEETFDTKGDKSRYWIGSEKNASIYTPGAKPKTVAVSGFYTATNRRRHIGQELIVR